MALFERISEREVDQVVSYVQAVIDLSYSPLFADGQPWPNSEVIIERDGTENQIFHVPDPYVFRSALIPFRRIWMEEEPSNFNKVRKTLSKHYPEAAQWYFKFLRDHYEQAKRSDMPWKLSRAGGTHDPNEEPVFAGEVINQGLYLDLFHCNPRKPRNKAPKHVSTTVGLARFEYMFVASVYELALNATILQPAATFCLNELKLQSRLRDSRLIRAVLPGDEHFPDGTVVRRFSPGYTLRPQFAGEKLSVLRRENAFIALNNLISATKLEDHTVAAAILASTNLSSLLECLGFEWSRTRLDLCSPNDAEASPSDDLDYSNRGVCGTVLKGSKIWCSDPKALEAELQSARSMLQDRQDWNTNGRQLWKLAMRNISVPFPIEKKESNYTTTSPQSTRTASYE